jgi:CDP-paratose 2-epimerase
MRKKTLLVTGSSGLIGSAVVENIHEDFEKVYGLDNNMRAVFFGSQGDIYGYKGKQVRDNIHSYDVAQFIRQFYANPRIAKVYNIGGGRGDSISMLEAFAKIEGISGIKMNYEYSEKNREGDHICYISNLSKMKSHYPGWGITKSLDDIFCEIVESWKNRLGTSPI